MRRKDKELLGHASITTTMKYAHPTPTHRKSAVDTLVADETSRLVADGNYWAEIPNAIPTQVVENNGAGESNRTADLRITNGKKEDDGSD